MQKKFFKDTIKVEFRTQLSNKKIDELIKEIYSSYGEW